MNLLHNKPIGVFDNQSLFIISHNGVLRRLICPFKVEVVQVIPNLQYGELYNVQSVMNSRDGIMVYYVLGKAYYFYNFIIVL